MSITSIVLWGLSTFTRVFIQPPLKPHVRQREPSSVLHATARTVPAVASPLSQKPPVRQREPSLVSQVSHCCNVTLLFAIYFDCSVASCLAQGYAMCSFSPAFYGFQPGLYILRYGQFLFCPFVPSHLFFPGFK